MNTDQMGKWAFLVGLVLVIVAAIVQAYQGTMMLLIFILGIVVGFLNISKKNATTFLLGVATLTIVGISFGMLSVVLGGSISTYLDSILANFVSFVGAAALVVAIKTIIDTSKK